METLTVQWGGIRVPVRKYKATDDLKVPFKQVHGTDGGAIRQPKICTVCGKEVPKEELYKGYNITTTEIDAEGKEIAVTKTLKFTPEQINALKPAASDILTVDRVVKLAEIPLMALGDGYFIGPNTDKKTGAPDGVGFELLRQALLAKGEIAVVTWTTATGEKVGVLIPDDKGFQLKIVLFAEQLRAPDYDGVTANIPADMLAKGIAALAKFEKPFDLNEYHETYVPAVCVLIEMAAKGQELPAPVIRKPVEQVGIEAALNGMLA